MNRLMKSMVTLLMVPVLSFVGHMAHAETVVGDDLEAVNAELAQKPAPKLVLDEDGAGSSISLFSTKSATYRYKATGELSRSASGRDITLYFDVPDVFADVQSARIELMSYDVDYPMATEIDITYLNGVNLNCLLRGKNGEWEQNTIPINNLNALKTPAIQGESARNTFFVDVNARNEGWITCISEATLIIKGAKLVEDTTFNVIASDGSEAGGVLVEWTELPNATYTLWRGEKRGEKTVKLASGSSTQYFDETANSNTCYHYTVEATTTSGISLYSTQRSGVTASDSGYYDGVTLPRIEDVILPEFWLEDKAPMKLKWNNYSSNKYQVTKLVIYMDSNWFRKNFWFANRKLTLTERDFAIKFSGFDPKNGFSATTPSFDFVGFTNALFSDDEFGKYKIYAKYTVKNLNPQGEEWKEKTFESPEKEIKICFNKYGGEDNTPNWYNYWPKTGAIKDKNLLSRSGFVYDSSIEEQGLLGECSPSASWKKISLQSFPTIYSYSGGASTYKVSNLAVAAEGAKMVRIDGKEVDLSSGKRGIEALGATILHEQCHGVLNNEYYNSEKAVIGDVGVIFETTIEALAEQVKALPNCDYKTKFQELYENSDLYVCDLDGDKVLDCYEDGGKYGKKYKIKAGNPNTHNLAGYRQKQDNEIIAHFAGKERVSGIVNTKKDWAFPGTNQNPEYSGLSRKRWVDSSERTTIVWETFGAFKSLYPDDEILNPKTKNSVVLSSSTPSYSVVTLASEEESSRTGGDLMELPSLYEFAGEGLSIDGGILDQTADYAVGNGYSALAISISFVNSGEAISAAEVSGYLVNEKNEPVAFAQTEIELPVGKTDVVLEFPGDSLQKMKSVTYRLAMVKVVERSGDLGMTMFSKSELANATFAYTNTQFVGKAANYLYNTFSEEKTQKGLQVEVKGSISTPGVYQLEARLEGADGDRVSHIGYKKEFTTGEMTASFVFPNEEIYLSRQNGPYDICFVRMSQDGVVLDERRMAYQTGAYSYADFTPANVCLVVDETSFKRGEDIVGADGLITNLSFTFDVDYQGDAEEQCHGWLYLYGEEDRIAAVSQVDVSLVKGRNTLEFLVDGASIQKNGVNGPYCVKGVLLEPQNGAAETFEPTMAPIELNVEDFGAYPFEVTGDVRFNKHTNGYDLVVPLEIMRANTITISAMLVDGEERCAATAKVSKTYTSSTTEEITLSFTNADIAESELEGPYKVRFIQIQTDIPNIPAANVALPTCTPTYGIVNGEAIITGCTSPVGTLEIPATIEGYPVTTIADGAFYECEDIESVIIPSSVTRIGYRAFEGCSGLTSVTIPSSVIIIGDWAFYNCSALTSATIPFGVSTIGDWAFYGCHGLTSVTIPSSVTSIGEYAFCGCYGLTTITIPSSVTSISDGAFGGCSGLTSVTIPEGVTSIGAFAFEGCSGLTSVTLPSSVRNIGADAFSGVTPRTLTAAWLPSGMITDNLATLVIPEGVTSVNEKAFENCSSLTSITLPPNLNSIASYAFSNCSGLTSVVIPTGVKSLGERAFSGCSGLISVTIPSSMTSIGSSAFWGCSGLTSVRIFDVATWCKISFSNYFSNPLYYATNLYLNGEIVKDLIIPSSVTSIGSSAFYGCKGLNSVTFNSLLKSIGSSAFEGCSGLTSVTIPEGVTSIGSSAFWGCSGLTSVTIPSSVTSIRGMTFLGCSGLTSITIPESVTSIGASAFNGCSGLISVTFPSKLKSLGSSAFEGCSKLKSAMLPQGLTAIEPLTFWKCSSLESVTIPTGVTKIGYSAFYDCTSLVSVIIPEGVTSIGRAIFEGCNSLTSVSLPSSIQLIEYAAFRDCANLYRDSNGIQYESSKKIVLVSVPTTLKGTVVIPESVRFVHSEAFFACSGVTSVLIPTSVTDIGARAFYNCSGLTSVTIPSSVTTISSQLFYGCSGLTTMIIPSNITSIESYAFSNCSGLTSMTIPPSVTSIGEKAFEGVSLETLTAAWLPTGMSTDNLKTLIIPDGVTQIGDNAFEGCSSLTSVMIPSSVTLIGDKAFEGVAPETLTAAWVPTGMSTDNLKTLIIPDGVTSIGNRAFYGCIKLTSVTIPSGVTAIGEYAFYWCNSLISIAIPEGVVSIGDYAFYGCYGLTSVTIPSSVASIGDWTFGYCGGVKITVESTNLNYLSLDGALFNKAMTHLIRGPGRTSTYTIPASVTSIGKGAFAWSSVTSVTIPEGVTLIDYAVFEGCSKLTSVTLPSSLTSIGAYAFRNCTGLTSVTIPPNVISIDSHAFEWCSGLTSVTIPSSVTTIGNYAFEGCSNLYKDANGVQYESAAKVVLIDVPTSMSGSFVIPDSVRFIHSNAFCDCSEVTSVTIPPSVIDIGGRAFYNCGGLTSVTIPPSVTAISSQMFSGCISLTSVAIPSSVVEIGYGAFEGVAPEALTAAWLPSGMLNDNLKTLIIPDGVTSIRSFAFDGCSGLTSVTIPSSVITIGDYAFDGCLNLKITVDAANSVYASKDGALFDKEMKTLIRGPGATSSYVIPSSVTTIGDSAFYGCSSLTSVTIPSSVTSISDYAFYNCSGLTSARLNGMPPTMGYYVFYGVGAGCIGYYPSTYASEWEDVISNGKWNGLTMQKYEVATLPEGIPEMTAEWLQEVLTASGVTSGYVTLAEGTTAKALEQARLLGITPAVNGTEVTVASSFEVSEVAVTAEAVTLSVTIAVEQGGLSENFTLGGQVTVMVCETLDGVWSEITPAPAAISLTRVSDTEATVSVRQAFTDDYNFFKVVVK